MTVGIAERRHWTTRRYTNSRFARATAVANGCRPCCAALLPNAVVCEVVCTRVYVVPLLCSSALSRGFRVDISEPASARRAADELLLIGISSQTAQNVRFRYCVTAVNRYAR